MLTPRGRGTYRRYFHTADHAIPGSSAVSKCSLREDDVLTVETSAIQVMQYLGRAAVSKCLREDCEMLTVEDFWPAGSRRASGTHCG
jgi:hypothetical protein